jgi:hypothetical protein
MFLRMQLQLNQPMRKTTALLRRIDCQHIQVAAPTAHFEIHATEKVAGAILRQQDCARGQRLGESNLISLVAL